MWLAPREPGGDPAYEIVRGIADSTPYAVPEAGAMLHVRRLSPGERTAVPAAPYVYVHVTRGRVRLDGGVLTAGDAARVTDEKGAEAVAEGEAEVLMWEMAAV
ncbi:Pirin family protein OS=Streptomyces tendae OX=1932 GN=F3L20_25465 PE=3 SV=1 [Streptomyces tendae]